MLVAVIRRLGTAFRSEDVGNQIDLRPTRITLQKIEGFNYTAVEVWWLTFYLLLHRRTKLISQEKGKGLYEITTVHFEVSSFLSLSFGKESWMFRKSLLDLCSPKSVKLDCRTLWIWRQKVPAKSQRLFTKPPWCHNPDISITVYV